MAAQRSSSTPRPTLPGSHPRSSRPRGRHSSPSAYTSTCRSKSTRPGAASTTPRTRSASQRCSTRWLIHAFRACASCACIRHSPLPRTRSRRSRACSVRTLSRTWTSRRRPQRCTGQHRGVALHVLECGEGANESLEGVGTFLSAICGTLVEVDIAGRALTLDDLLTVTHALSHSRDGLRTLRIHVECCGPASLALLSAWLPRLEDVQLTVQLLCGTTLPYKLTLCAAHSPSHPRRSQCIRICFKAAASGKARSSCTTSPPFCAMSRHRRTLRRCSA
jgi:hypothetical protein